MSDGVKEATLGLAAGDEFLDRQLQQCIREEYPELADAAIEVLWQRAKPRSVWGQIKVANEETYLLTDGTDLVLHLNQDLWKDLDGSARLGLLSHFLWQVRAKTGGITIQQTENGERALYKKVRPSLTVAPVVIARHPALCDQLPELAAFRKAAGDPRQYLLDFSAPDAEQIAA